MYPAALRRPFPRLMPLPTALVGQVIDMHATFSGASAWNQPLGAWRVSKVQSMGGMFDCEDGCVRMNLSACNRLAIQTSFTAQNPTVWPYDWIISCPPPPPPTPQPALATQAPPPARGHASAPHPTPGHTNDRVQFEPWVLLLTVFVALCVAFALFYRRFSRHVAGLLRSRDQAEQDLQLLCHEVQARAVLSGRGPPRPPGSCSLPSLPPGPPSSSAARSQADAEESETEGSEHSAAAPYLPQGKGRPCTESPRPPATSSRDPTPKASRDASPRVIRPEDVEPLDSLVERALYPA